MTFIKMISVCFLTCVCLTLLSAADRTSPDDDPEQIEMSDFHTTAIAQLEKAEMPYRAQPQQIAQVVEQPGKSADDSANVTADEPVPPDIEDPSFFNNLWKYLRENAISSIGYILLFMEVMVRLTPTEKDNAWLSWLKKIFDTLIPNRKTGGGTHANA